MYCIHGADRTDLAHDAVYPGEGQSAPAQSPSEAVFRCMATKVIDIPCVLMSKLDREFSEIFPF